MKKKLVVLMLTGIMAFSMTACGGSDKGAEESSDSTASETSSKEPEEAPEESEDVKVINSFVGQPLQGLMDKLSEIDYEGTYLADGVDFTSFIGDLAEDYSVDSVEINEADKTVSVNIIPTSNIEATDNAEALADKLDPGASWTAAEDYGENQFPYGFELHYLTGKIAEEAYDEDTWFLKAECTSTNESGAKVDGTCEAKVTGTTDSPEVTEFTVY